MASASWRTEFEAERADLPDRLVLDEAANVLATDQRDVFAELLLVQLDQAAAVLALLRAHLAEHIGGGGIVVAQALGDVGVDAAVLFLVGDRQGEDFAFGQLGEVSHGGNLAGARERSSKAMNDANATHLRPISSTILRAACHALPSVQARPRMCGMSETLLDVKGLELPAAGVARQPDRCAAWRPGRGCACWPPTGRRWRIFRPIAARPAMRCWPGARRRACSVS